MYCEPSTLATRRSLCAFSQSDLARRWTGQGHLVASEVVSAEEDQPLLLQHPRVFFPSYPWEWTPGQWVAAGELTLELMRPVAARRLDPQRRDPAEYSV